MAQSRLATLALVLLAGGLAGCFHPAGNGSPGPDNPQLVLYRTDDLATQLVVKGAFKEREYDRIEIVADGALLAAENHTYLVSEKVNRSSFDLAVFVTAGTAVYSWRGLLTQEDDGVRIVEIVGGVAGKPDLRAFPFTRILEKEPETKVTP